MIRTPRAWFWFSAPGTAAVPSRAAVLSRGQTGVPLDLTGKINTIPRTDANARVPPHVPNTYTAEVNLCSDRAGSLAGREGPIRSVCPITADKTPGRAAPTLHIRRHSVLQEHVLHKAQDKCEWFPVWCRPPTCWTGFTCRLARKGS